MRTLSFSEAKMELNSLVGSVSPTDEEMTVKKSGRQAAVLISLDG